MAKENLFQNLTVGDILDVNGGVVTGPTLPMQIAIKLAEWIVGNWG